MRKFSILAVVALATGLGGIGPSVAGNMGDPSAHMRRMQEICDAQRRGEYPRDHDACLPDDPPADRR
jgi:hypothetical protein